VITEWEHTMTSISTESTRDVLCAVAISTGVYQYMSFHTTISSVTSPEQLLTSLVVGVSLDELEIMSASGGPPSLGMLGCLSGVCNSWLEA
jgi:hypothetical protein